MPATGPGTVVAATAWTALDAAFSWYAARAGNYGQRSERWWWSCCGVAVGGEPPAVAVLQGPVAFVELVVVEVADEGVVGQVGGSAEGPVLDVVGLALAGASSA
ncbi:MAG: hypothetical protein JWN17_2540, partial [Frankiales bacterium]|nr:hypothetical protein [Frankiales bacterium]